MLRIFRSIACQPTRLRPTVTAVRTASYSTARDEHDELQDMLQEEGDRNPISKFANLSASSNAASGPSLSENPWAPFRETTFIQPHHFSMRSRTKDTNTVYKKPPLVGPARREARYNDVFYQLGIDPLEECQNASLLSAFLTDMGKIKHRKDTGLTNRSQRRLSKAIRRAKMMGVIPVLSKRYVRFGGR